MNESTIRAIDAHSVHRITSGQVVIDLQTAVKELVENSLDAGATSIELRFQNYGLKTIEVVDNGCGIAPSDFDSIALKHYTSKLSSFEGLSRVLTFGFRGEALSSLCALTDGFTITTATASDAPMGTFIDLDRNGKVRSKCKIARQRGTTVAVSSLFKSLPVRRKEFERNTKREFQKALNLLYAYALVPCALENKGVRFAVSNQTEGGRKVIQFKTDGSSSIRASVVAIWGSKTLENIVDLNLSFDVETEKSILKRVDVDDTISIVTPVKVQGLISKFAVGAGRTSVDRQFFFVNGRPYSPGKVQRAINEVYRTFNVNQSPFVVANVILPTNACDINVTPDKRTIFLHSENNLVQALKTALETTFSSARSTYDVTVQPLQTQGTQRSGQQAKGQGKPQTQTRERDPEVSKKLVSSASDEPEERRRMSQPPPQLDDAHRNDARDSNPVTFGAPHLLLGAEADVESASHSEPEPEPTLVARPVSSGKGSGSRARDETGQGNGKIIDRPRSRARSESLFFPDSDEEGNDPTGRVDKGKKKESARSDRNRDEHACPPLPAHVTLTTSSAASSSTSAATLTHFARPSTSISDKPRSVQAVLSTRGAAWNLQRDGDANTGTGRERKRARLSSEGDRLQAKKKDFRSTLSQFLNSGSKALQGEKEGEGRSKGKSRRGREIHDDSEEEDELDEEDESEERPGKGRKKRPRSGSNSSQVTMVVLSDDEHAMGVDESPSTITKPSRTAAPSIPQTAAEDAADRAEDVDGPSEDDWAFSSTLVGTYVPPASKTAEPSSNPRPTETATDSVTLRVNLVNIGAHYLDMYNHLLSSSESSSSPPVLPPSSTLRSAVSSANLETAAEDTIASAALSRIISKADFEHMIIVGQFNLGFIIARKRNDDPQGGGEATMDDLFIVDQHAADEKWNFETLQANTVIASQRLFRPRELQLTAADEMLALENMDVLKLNGFELERVEEPDASEDGNESSSGVRMRLQLVAQPMSKDTVFDMKDLEELVHLMQDRPRGTMVRCSKARAMFAMRACRRSVMIGKALDKTRMTTIVRHMGTMDQPWNCPHGRPTMRHLSDLTSFGRYALPRREIDWETYAWILDGGGMTTKHELDKSTVSQVPAVLYGTSAQTYLP